ncbi:MAG: hypothetical protein LBL66_09570 [Clostridiales bacterium]|jgi:2-keto-3-deoxy-L-rhamnonate aldolase RhmA|nr:hypothetical protein [Clostridiales bacterium]
MKVKRKLGTMVSEIGFAGLPTMMKNAGFDFLILDLEHGAFDYAGIRAIVGAARGCGLKTVMRLPDNGRREITRLCDMGAGGFLLPMAESAADVAWAVRYAKYAPEGARGISTMRAHTGYDPGALADYMKTANASMEIYAQIETRRGMDNLRDILKTDYLTGAFLGPNDLSADLNCIGDLNPILKAMETLAAECARAHKPAGIITSNETLLAKAAALQFARLCVSSELNILSDGYKKLRKTLSAL